MPQSDNKKAGRKGKPSIILVRSQLGQNIGTAARAMANFGLDEMRLVAPRDGWPSEYAQKAASGADHVIDAARVFERAQEAVADLNFVMATTARPRDMTVRIFTPEEAAKEMHRRIARGEKTGVLFGPERSGLENDEIALADAIVMAPVNPGFASLNLAQAVLMFAYEWYKPLSTSLGDGRRIGKPGAAGLNMRKSRRGTKEELIGFFKHLEHELDEAGFLRPVEKRPTMVRNIRNLFQRAELTEQEVRTLRGIVASLVRQHKRMD